MSDRKETPDLLGDILANQKDDSDDRDEPMDNKPQDMATAPEASNRFGVSERTIRTWAAEFADHLSAGANPAKGEIRAFTNDDMTVLATIARLRSHNVSYKDIHIALKAALQAAPIAGEGAQPWIGEQPPEPTGERGGIAQDLSRQYERRIEGLKGERDRLAEQVKVLNEQVKALNEQVKDLKGQVKALEGQLAETQTARLDVEERAVTAEDPEWSQRKEEEPPSAPDRVFTLEDQLRQLAARDHWWRLWRRK